MKLFRRRLQTIPDDPATEKQIDYIKELVLAVGPQSRPILKRNKISPDLTDPEDFTYLGKSKASACIDSLLNMEPATDNQRGTLAHNAAFTYTGLCPEEKANLDRARRAEGPRLVSAPL